MASVQPGTSAWLDQVVEDVVEPERRIIDPHHHLRRRSRFPDYLLGDLWADTGSGHRVEKTVFVEWSSSYREDVPEQIRCLGETKFVAEIAQQSEKHGPDKSVIAGIVAHADLTLGDAVEEVLQAHEKAGRGLFRGIRHIGARDPELLPNRAPEHLYSLESYRRAVRVLGRLGYTNDCWHLHHQNRDFADLARAVPETTMVLDHFGTPIGVGSYADRREEIFSRWRKDIITIASCPNVVAKLGGLAMPINGFGWDRRGKPATSDELVETQRRYYLHTVEAFGPARCMFESNFPVDKSSISYRVLWNAFKKMVSDFTEEEKHALFLGTAARVYRL